MKKELKKEITPEEMAKDLEERADRFIKKVQKAQDEEQLKMFAHLRIGEDGILPIMGIDDLKYKAAK